MRGRIITFTNLFPSAAFPTHGLFVQERMRRVAAESGLDWVVVAPVPWVPPGLRRDAERRFAAMPDREQVDGVEVWHPRYFHLPGLSTTAQARRMARGAREVLGRLAAGVRAVVDAHYVYPDGVAALRLAERLGVPTVVTARGTDLNVLAQAPAVARQIRERAPRAFARLAVSEPLRVKFVAAAGVADDAVRLSRNGVDLVRFAPGDAAAARRELGLPSGPLVLGCGRLVAGKGFHLIAERMSALPGATLVLVGDGPERAAIERAAGARVRVLGAQPPERVALAYRACDVLVLPSEREGWPNVVTEALASGLPVVATAVGSVPTMLDAQGVGCTVPVGDGEALVREVGALLAQPPDRARVRAHAARFSWDEPVRDLVALFEAALR